MDIIRAISKPVFIIGCSRTGSKIYMNILSRFSDINISPEIHYISPHWIRKDFVSHLREIGDLSDDNNVEKLVWLMAERNFHGSFWNQFNMPTEMLRLRIIRSDRSLKSIFEILLSLHAELNKKNRFGAKFPVHFSYADKLMEWFPECKIVHITRDPRAIYSSHSKKMNDQYRGYVSKFVSFIHISMQFKWAGRIHGSLKGLPNYYLSRYEDIVASPDIYIRRLCDFLETEFKEEMLVPPVQDSSFQKNVEKGMDRDALLRWKKHISPFAAMLMKVIVRKEMKEVGYS
jgi:hypothetical protein